METPDRPAGIPSEAASRALIGAPFSSFVSYWLPRETSTFSFSIALVLIEACPFSNFFRFNLEMNVLISLFRFYLFSLPFLPTL